MLTTIVRIGNSRGIRIPKAILAQCGIDETVDLMVADGKIILSPAASARQGWAEAANEMAKQHDDILLDELISTAFDDEDWEW